jgi:hypothetical protein
LVREAVAHFTENYRRRTEELGHVFARLRDSQKRTVVWGAGAKGITLLNKFRSLAAIEYVVDINPYKQGKYVSGTGQEIVAPQFLKNYRPDAILLTNSNYRDEIELEVRQLGLEPVFLLA